VELVGFEGVGCGGERMEMEIEMGLMIIYILERIIGASLGE